MAPSFIDPSHRNQVPGSERVLIDAAGEETVWVHWMGTDTLGRDVYSRVIYGARVSLLVGVVVAILSVVVGLFIGLVSGYIRWLDAIVMRIMDGLMAIPAILLAIALVSLWGGGVATVMIAITIPEIPRVVRLVRSIVLTIREEPYVEAAISVGTPVPLILIRHVPAQHDRALDRAGHLCLRLGDPGRGDLELPRRRYSAGHPDLGQHHGGGPGAVSGLSPQHPVPRHLPRLHRARGEHFGRRPARHPRSALGAADLVVRPHRKIHLAGSVTL